MLEDLLDSASVGGRRAMTDLQKAAEFFDGDDDRGILLEGLVGIAAGLVDAINGVTVPDESCGPRCNCGSCDDTGSEHGFGERDTDFPDSRNAKTPEDGLASQSVIANSPHEDGFEEQP